MPSQQTTNAIKIAGSIGVLAASEIFMPGSSAVAKGATVVAGLDVGGFCKDVLKSVFGNFTHQFMNNIDAQRLFDRFGSGEKELNHDIEKLMLSCLPTSIEFLKNRYLALNPYKNQFVEDTLNRLVADANIDTDTIKDYDLMASDKDAWLSQIHDYIFRGQTDHEGELAEIETFFKANLVATFQLHFIEGLKDPSDEKPLKAFLIKTLHGLNDQAQKIAETQEQILTEIKNLKDNLPNKTVTPSRSYFEKEFVRVNKKLDELLTVAKEIKQDTTEIKEDVKVLRAILEPKIIYSLPRDLNYIPRIDIDEECIGRDTNLVEIEKELEKSQKLLLINGKGGIGKTTVAKAYVSYYKDKYAHFVWVSTTIQDYQEKSIKVKSLQEAFADDFELKQNLKIDFTNLSVVDTFSLVMNKLKTIPNKVNLLVIDNAIKDSETQNIWDKIPTPPNWQVLVTSRNQFEGFKKYKISELPIETAKKLFINNYKPNRTPQEYIELLKNHDLEDLLIEIELNTKYVKMLAKCLHNHLGDYNFKSVKTALQQNRLKDISNRINIDNVEIPLIQHISFLFDFNEFNDEEIYLLKQFIFLPIMPIPKQDLIFLLNISESKKKWFNDTLLKFEDLTFLEKQEIDSLLHFQIHRTVQLAIINHFGYTMNDAKLMLNRLNTFFSNER